MKPKRGILLYGRSSAHGNWLPDFRIQQLKYEMIVRELRSRRDRAPYSRRSLSVHDCMSGPCMASDIHGIEVKPVIQRAKDKIRQRLPLPVKHGTLLMYWTFIGYIYYVNSGIYKRFMINSKPCRRRLPPGELQFVTWSHGREKKSRGIEFQIQALNIYKTQSCHFSVSFIHSTSISIINNASYLLQGLERCWTTYPKHSCSFNNIF